MRNWLPDHVDRRIRLAGILSLIAQLTIVVTGGAVRLTGSGLGCPTWPSCTADSLVPTAAMGIHGVIEFSNRMMSGVVGILALIVLVLVWRIRKKRRDLFVLSLIVLLGVVAQAVVGGITVWTGLNPFIVGFHFVASVILVCVATSFVVRSYFKAGPRQRAVPGWFAGLTHLTSFFLALTILAGVLTTGSGPHSGDSNVARSGINAGILEHVHSWPAYITFALTLLLLIVALERKLAARWWVVGLLAVEVAQIGVGLLQARTGLPGALVGLHMLLACGAAALMTVLILNLKVPAAAVSAAVR